MNPEDVISIIEEIMELLEPTAQKVWQLALRQIQVKLYGNLLGVLVSFVCGVVGYLCLRRGTQDKDDGTFYGGDFWYAAASASFIIAFFLFLGCLLSIIGYLVNPEWAAIQLLLNQ